MESSQFKNLPQEKFELVQRDESIFDTKFETKPVGYLKDALLRFRKNKASVVAFFVLMFLVLFAIVVPEVSNYDLTTNDPVYKQVLPRTGITDGTGFWDGTKIIDNMTDIDYEHNLQIPGYIVKHYSTYEKIENGTIRTTYHKVRVDTYAIGYRYVSCPNLTEFNEIREYEAKTGKQVLYPILDVPSYYTDTQAADPNWYYATNQETDPSDSRPLLDSNGEIITLYKVDDNNELIYYRDTGGGFEIRVDYHNYFVMVNGYEPIFVFGANASGEDIMTRLAIGARFSLLLGVCVSLINIIIGICYGAIEGYYGGTVDLILERISDILSQVPFMIVAVLFNLYLSEKVGILPTLAFAFVLTGWIGVASRVRMQFYRYKGQEYVLAARTLGAKDSRLIFRHILPNAIGTIITSCVLMIPSVIFSESSLSYLGVIDLQTDTSFTSVGTILQEGQGHLQNYPHILLFPALFIALLMISFNIFGRGLRDAFNPSLRGVEE